MCHPVCRTGASQKRSRAFYTGGLRKAVEGRRDVDECETAIYGDAEVNRISKAARLAVIWSATIGQLDCGLAQD